MDFFAAEQRAKKRTARLLVLFGFAVAGTVAVGYLASVVLIYAANAKESLRYGYGEAPPLEFWQPGLFAAVAAATLAVKMCIRDRPLADP